jgi:hypothetical protein
MAEKYKSAESGDPKAAKPVKPGTMTPDDDPQPERPGATVGLTQGHAGGDHGDPGDDAHVLIGTRDLPGTRRTREDEQAAAIKPEDKR